MPKNDEQEENIYENISIAIIEEVKKKKTNGRIETKDKLHVFHTKELLKGIILNTLKEHPEYTTIDTEHAAEQIAEKMEFKQAEDSKTYFANMRVSAQEKLTEFFKTEKEIESMTKAFCKDVTRILVGISKDQKVDEHDKNKWKNVYSFSDALSEDKKESFDDLYEKVKNGIQKIKEDHAADRNAKPEKFFEKIKHAISNFFDKVAGLFGQDKCSKEIKAAINNFVKKDLAREILTPLKEARGDEKGQDAADQGKNSKEGQTKPQRPSSMNPGQTPQTFSVGKGKGKSGGIIIP